MRMRLQINNFIKKSINFNYYKPHKTPLGRWKPYENEDLKIYYANIDHCGDRICGNPKIVKNEIFYKK